MLRIIAIGRLRAGPEQALFERYVARIRPRVQVTEIAEPRGGGKHAEAASLLASLPDAAFAVVLDEGGEAVDSATLARLLDRWLGLGRPVCFLIGGADGLDARVTARADFTLSLGRLTWPHLLVRAMLAEQLYRARAIVAGHPYHRAGRP